MDDHIFLKPHRYIGIIAYGKKNNKNKFVHRKLCFTHSSHVCYYYCGTVLYLKNYVSMWFKIESETLLAHS